jgi:hypothetical protein
MDIVKKKELLVVLRVKAGNHITCGAAVLLI